MTEECTGDDNKRQSNAMMRDRLTAIAGQQERRPEINIGEEDLGVIMRQMIPVMAVSGRFFRYAENLTVIEEYEAPPRLLINRDGDGSISSEIVCFTAPVICDGPLLMIRLCDIFRFFKIMQNGRSPKQPTVALANQLISLRGVGLPPLKAVVDYPVMNIDGKIISEEGVYDPDLAIYFAPGRQCKIKRFTDPHHAYNFLRKKWLGEFDFKDEGDFWRAICYVASLLCRRTVLADGEGNPIFLFTAPMASSGKTALAKSLYAAVTGRTLPVNPTDLKDHVEMKKSLFALALSSVPGALFDNAPRGIPIRSSVLEAYATSDEYRDRVLSMSKEATASTLAVMAITGNNIEPGGDMASRSLSIRLAPDTNTPALRKYKKNIIDWTVANRDQILGAVACLLQQKCKPEDEPRGRFDPFNKVIGGPIVTAAKLNGYRENIFDQWYDVAEGEGAKNAEINALCEAMIEGPLETYSASDLRQNAPEELINLLGIEDDPDGLKPSEILEKMPISAIGRRLGVFADYVSGEYRLATKDKRNKKTRKKVVFYTAVQVRQ